jgi:hypothetical protein
MRKKFKKSPISRKNPNEAKGKNKKLTIVRVRSSIN